MTLQKTKACPKCGMRLYYTDIMTLNKTTNTKTRLQYWAHRIYLDMAFHKMEICTYSEKVEESDLV